MKWKCHGALSLGWIRLLWCLENDDIPPVSSQWWHAMRLKTFVATGFYKSCGQPPKSGHQVHNGWNVTTCVYFGHRPSLDMHVDVWSMHTLPGRGQGVETGLRTHKKWISEAAGGNGNWRSQEGPFSNRSNNSPNRRRSSNRRGSIWMFLLRVASRHRRLHGIVRQFRE